MARGQRSTALCPGTGICYDHLMVELSDIALAPDRIRPLRRAEYDRLVAQGAFSEERLELLKGLIVSMSPQGPRHAAVIRRLTMLLAPALAGRAELQVQSPLALSEVSEPEPDLAVVPPGDYLDDHPQAAELVIEVADVSLGKDRDVKAALYAAAGIPEYWIVDLRKGRVEVYSEPEAETYRSKVTLSPGDEIGLQCYPDVRLRVSDFLPADVPADGDADGDATDPRG